MAILVSDQVDGPELLEIKGIKRQQRNKEEHFIMLEGSSHQEDVTIPNAFA